MIFDRCKLRASVAALVAISLVLLFSAALLSLARSPQQAPSAVLAPAALPGALRDLFDPAADTNSLYLEHMQVQWAASVALLHRQSQIQRAEKGSVEYARELAVALIAALSAARRAVAEQLAGPDVAHIDIVRSVMESARAEIQRRYPNIPVTAAESPLELMGSRSKPVWIVDVVPAFISERQVTVTAVTLLVRGEPVVSCVVAVRSVGAPEVFTAMIGSGACKNGALLPRMPEEDRTLEMSRVMLSSLRKISDLPDARFSKLGSAIASFRFSSGSMALDLCRLAESDIDIVISEGMNPGSAMAGVLIVREVHGFVLPIGPGQWSSNSETIVAGHRSLVEHAKIFL